MTAPTPLTARLAMYDWPQIQPANDALWARWRKGMNQRGIAAPEALDRADRDERDIDGLLISQVCGVTFARHLAGKSRLIATPCYRADGCAGPNYSSVIVVADDSQFGSTADLEGATAAINSRSSFSGWFALHAATGAGPNFFGNYRVTGAHVTSADTVAQGAADCAALDAVCWSLIGKYHPDLRSRLRVLAHSPSLPGLPLIAGPSCDEAMVTQMRDALFEALADPDLRAACDALLITGAEVLTTDHYDTLLPYTSLP